MAPGNTSPEKTAPGPLELVQRFVNSVDLESGEDELTSPEALNQWLAKRGLMGRDERVSAADLERVVDVREGVRALLLANSGLRPDPDRIERLDAAVAGAAVRMRFRPGADPALEPEAGGGDGGIGRLMAVVAGAGGGGGLTRPQACPPHPPY